MKKLHAVGMIVGLLTLTMVTAGCGGSAVDRAPAGVSTPAAVAAAGEGDGSAAAPPDQGTVATATPEPQNAAGDTALSDVLTEDYEGALSTRNQLALGTLRLTQTDAAVDAEQAGTLTLYWQALKALTADTTAASEEIAALQEQITEAMTPDQLATIKAMALTDADLTAFYSEMGLEMPSPVDGETPTGPGGGGRSGMSREEREAAKATATALGTPVGTGGNGAARRDVLMDQVIELLATVASG